MIRMWTDRLQFTWWLAYNEVNAVRLARALATPPIKLLELRFLSGKGLEEIS